MARPTKIDIWVPKSELDRIRAHALLAGFSRKEQGKKRLRGDISKLVRSLMEQRDTVWWDELTTWFRKVGWDMASVAEISEPLRKIEVRVTLEERATMDAMAVRCGMVRGGRGNSSAFLRALLRYACGL